MHYVNSQVSDSINMWSVLSLCFEQPLSLRNVHQHHYPTMRVKLSTAYNNVVLIHFSWLLKLCYFPDQHILCLCAGNVSIPLPFAAHSWILTPGGPWGNRPWHFLKQYSIHQQVHCLMSKYGKLTKPVQCVLKLT